MERGTHWGKITIAASAVLADTKIGDSIAINGVCLTVTRVDAAQFSADVMAETLTRTNLGAFVPGDKVNLERALRPMDRMGGHIVQGHVDGTGVIIRDETAGIARLISIRASKDLLTFIVEKGSVAVDGISLTVTIVGSDHFQVSLIPHTAVMTTLGYKHTGQTVNLETDILGRYVYRLTAAFRETPAEQRVDGGFLAENGFL